MSWLTQNSEILTGIFVYDHSQVHAAIIILLDCIHRSRFSCQGQIENVGTAARTETDTATLADFTMPKVKTLQAATIRFRVPTIHASSLPRCESCRGVRASARERAFQYVRAMPAPAHQSRTWRVSRRRSASGCATSTFRRFPCHRRSLQDSPGLPADNRRG